MYTYNNLYILQISNHKSFVTLYRAVLAALNSVTHDMSFKFSIHYDMSFKFSIHSFTLYMHTFEVRVLTCFECDLISFSRLFTCNEKKPMSII